MKEWGGKGETELEWMRWMGDGFELRVDILKWMKASFHVYFLLFISFLFFICFSSNCFSFCVNFMTIGFFLVRFFLPFLVKKYHRLLFCSFWPSEAEMDVLWWVGWQRKRATIESRENRRDESKVLTGLLTVLRVEPNETTSNPFQGFFNRFSLPYCLFKLSLTVFVPRYSLVQQTDEKWVLSQTSFSARQEKVMKVIVVLAAGGDLSL